MTGSERSSVTGGYWHPHGTLTVFGAPAEGDVIAWRHAAWRVVEITDCAPGKPTAMNGRRWSMRLRPKNLEDHPDPVAAAAKDVHLGFGASIGWHVFNDPDHFPACARCHEPTPCREQVAREEAEKSVARMEAYEKAGMCPACRKVVTHRQKRITFSENMMIPVGPPVTFHLRGRCAGEAVVYEKRWAAAAPDNRRCTLSCPGNVVNHNNGTYDCTELGHCPGPDVPHPQYSMCACPPCHAEPWTWGSGCRPDRAARLNLPEVTS